MHGNQHPTGYTLRDYDQRQGQHSTLNLPKLGHTLDTFLKTAQTKELDLLLSLPNQNQGSYLPDSFWAVIIPKIRWRNGMTGISLNTHST